MNQCFCGAASGRCFEARQTLFDEQGVYRYQICTNCGSARLVEGSPVIAHDLYEGQYGTLRGSRWRSALRCLFNALAYRNPVLGEAVGTLLPFVNHAVLRIIQERQPGRSARLLDVGCGVGRFLQSLRYAGFMGSCLGVDPFLSSDHLLPGGIELVQGEIGDVQGRFDVITIVHVLEHSAAPVEMLRAANERLKEGGIVLVTIPLFGGTAWERYGPDWIQLDAPRHAYLHTRTSLGIAASAAGLRIEREVCDSTVFQFWGSDVVKRRGYLYPLQGGDLVLLCRRLRAYLREVAKVNDEGLGDQGTFMLQPSLS